MRVMDKDINNLSKTKNFLRSRDFFLIILLIIVFFLSGSISENFFKLENLLDTTTIFMEKSILALPMTLLMVAGIIDISVAAMMALSVTVMGYCYCLLGLNIWVAIVISLITGILLGLFNGLVVTKLKIPSIVVTIATMLSYRGIVQVILKDRVLKGFPEQFSIFGGSYKIFNIPIPLIIFTVFAVIFGLILHSTKIGRELYLIGNNEETCRYSGIDVDKKRIFMFCIMGLVSAIVGIILASRISAIRMDIGTGYEFEVITIVILGGVTISGGRGSILGVILSVFIIGYIHYGLMLINVREEIITIILGLILIITLVIPNIRINFSGKIQKTIKGRE